MIELDDDDRLGLPRGAVAPPPLRPTPRPAGVTPAEPSLRDGDSELGRPPQVPALSEALTDADRRQLRLADEDQARRDLEEAAELLAADPALPSWLGRLIRPVAAIFLLGSVGLVGLTIVSQTLSVLANLATQPPAIQYAGYFGLTLFAGLAAYALVRVLLLYVRLEGNRQLRLAGLEELQTRTRLRWLADAKTAEARARLTRYLDTFPLDRLAAKRPGRALGFDAALVAALVQAREELQDPSRFHSSADWFDLFRHRFQARLDELAEERVKHWANRAMVVTAVSPSQLVDTVSTLYFGLAMLGDLCLVYNLRVGRTGTAVLLGRVFFQAYLAGQMSDLEPLLEGQADQLFEQAFHTVGIGVGSSVASKVLGKVGAKATAGYLNRLLLLRLGRHAARLLRPVAA